MTTPIVPNANPDDHKDCELPPLRTVLAYVRMTPLITLRIIWNHHETQVVLITSLLTLLMLDTTDDDEVEDERLVDVDATPLLLLSSNL